MAFVSLSPFLPPSFLLPLPSSLQRRRATRQEPGRVTDLMLNPQTCTRRPFTGELGGCMDFPESDV